MFRTLAPDQAATAAVRPAWVVPVAYAWVGAAVVHRTTEPPRPLVPAWMVPVGTWIGVTLLVVRVPARREELHAEQ